MILEPLGITQTAFARHIGMTTARLSEIIHEKRPVTMDSALRMQLTVDLDDAVHGRAAKAVARIRPIDRAS